MSSDTSSNNTSSNNTSSKNSRRFSVLPEVAEALNANRPVVAFESTVFSTLGLPMPANRDALEAAHSQARALGVVPAMTAVIDGVARVGIDPSEHDKILTAHRKVAERDLAVAVAQRWPVGVTTVSASVALAARAGIRVFATGGIGGVHRDVATSDDVSADLGALSRHAVVTVCAGAKSFLALDRTLERLETLGVPVVGFKTDRLPAFTSLDSGLDVPYRCETALEVADIAQARQELGQGGMLVTVPPPNPISDAVLDRATTKAEAAAAAEGVRGAALTPFILGRIAAETSGASVNANIALVVNNAAVASQIAEAITHHAPTD